MRIEILKGDAILELDELSRSIGNNPMIPGIHLASVLRDEDGSIKGFAAVHTACHAGGSYVHPDHRLHGLSYELRKALEVELKAIDVFRYFAIPQNKFERNLFKKYGPVIEKLVQVKVL